MTTTNILQYLEEHYSYSGRLDESVFSRMALAALDTDNNSNDVLYVSTNETVLPDGYSILLCEDLQKLTTLVPNRLYVETKITTHEFIELFDRYIVEKDTAKETCLKIYEFISKEKYIEPLMDLCYEYFKNPLQTVDHNHALVSYRQEGRVDFPEWQTFVDNKKYDNAYLNNEFYENQTKATYTKEVRRIVTRGHHSFLCSIIVNGIYMGSVSLLQFKKTVTKYDIEVLSVMAKVISLNMEQSVTNVGIEHQHTKILHDLLNGDIKNEDSLEFRLKMSGWNPPKAGTLILFLHAPDIDYERKKQIIFAVGTTFPHLKTIPYRRYALGLVDGDAEKLFDELDVFCKLHNVQVGVSNKFSKLLRLSDYYSQAKKALQFGRLSQSKHHIHRYQDYLFEDISSVLSSAYSTSFCYSDVVLKLRKYDIENGTDFSDTLFTYIEQSKSISKTSRLLHLHKNTVNYRIQRVKELYDLDLNDFKELMHIYLSYKMLKDTELPIMND